jgi:EPS-associated MarR family transcriptional regulator
MDQEIHLKVLRQLEENSDITQRQLAQQLGVSLGKANYCLKALIDKGFIKARNFKNSDNKRAYLYVLTPRGIEEKSRISVSFLRRKLEDFEALRSEIEEVQAEVHNNNNYEEH